MENEPNDLENNLENNPEEKKRKSALPAFAISAFVHSLLVLITFLVIISTSKPKEEDIIITTELTEEIEEVIEPEVKRDVVKEKVEVVVQTEVQAAPMVTTEETTDHNETDNNMEAETAEGTAEGITDSPQVGSGLMGNIGGGGGGGGTFGTRSGGGKKRALLKGGGSAKTESAVDAALRWLMRHQEKDGRWDREKYGNDNDNGGFARPQTEPHAALTGLATLAFLSAGHTPKLGKYKNTVKLAVDWILSKQQVDGSFGYSQDYSVYDNAICTLALAEVVAMYPDPKIKIAAQKAVDFLANLKTIHMGMSNYASVAKSTSVNGWLMMAFKSAKIAGLNVPPEVFEKFRKRMDDVTDKDASGYLGTVSYLNPGDRKNSANKTMTAVGMLIYEYLGVNRADLDNMAEILIKDLPVWGTYNINNDMYKWYYTTLALFQFGGEHWKKWNKSMIEVLVKNQRVGGPLDGSLQDVDGSWDFEGDFWGRNLGRTYTTAMGAFCLEVYYRYESVLR